MGNFRTSHRIAAGLAVLAGAAGLSAAARAPFTVKGVTYRVKVETKLPTMTFGGGGGGGGGDVGGGGGGGFPGGFGGFGGVGQLVRVEVAGDRAKVEFQVGQPPGSSITDYYLMMLDSNKTYRVSPDNQTYSDASLSPTGGRGRGGFGNRGGGGGNPGGGARPNRGNRGGGDNAGGGGRGGRGGGFVNPMQVLSDMIITDMKTSTEDLGAGEVMDGRPTRHYRVTVDFGFKLYGQPKTAKTTTEVWTIDYPARIVNPFDSVQPASDDSTIANVNARLADEAKKLPGVPVKIVTTQTLPVSAVGADEADVSANGAVSQTVDIVRTTTITAIKDGDLDEADFTIPADYKKTSSFGRGGQ